MSSNHVMSQREGAEGVFVLAAGRKASTYRNSWLSLECTKETFRAIYPLLLSKLMSEGNVLATPTRRVRKTGELRKAGWTERCLPLLSVLWWPRLTLSPFCL